MDVTLRHAGPADVAVMRRAVYAAWKWREPWDESAFRAHLLSADPDSYVDAFGARVGDAGLVAANADGVCGAAWFRRFTRENARAGFVDDSTPELVLAVDDRFRGTGIGGRLLDGLLDLAVDQSVSGLSLHVDSANGIARALYLSRGFALHRSTPKGAVMVWAEPVGGSSGR
ncbi:GNAT family N-acetyltransferase [Brachybacterium sp. NBEC-018]|uniref:GNAT family N-acetyltransferase n=1 Tax=Brachybacterium sp. NBEC-018 TaxID=2996004 RepID=UPI00217563EA|nr:GNAT family N-acetyltransferase [Brachybacterium sp. NBEC-018]UVY84700.1 GNAT family N-acetyltransferase [Brachybacterium sp. NBEC-018]